jgi:hypothetical protein
MKDKVQNFSALGIRAVCICTSEVEHQKEWGQYHWFFKSGNCTTKQSESGEECWRIQFIRKRDVVLELCKFKLL